MGQTTEKRIREMIQRLEYEKKYKEALADMKVIYPNLKGDAKLAVEHAFPELAESEDERIRKWLVELVENQKPKMFTEVKKMDVFAWLEKQKEQKEIPLMNGDAELYFDNWIQHNDTTKRGYFEEGIRYAQRLQKEQKPAEWSEEDEKMKERLITKLNWITYNTRTDSTSLNITFFDEIEWLKSLRPQKKEDLPKWRKWRNGGCGNADGIPIAIVKSGTGYELVSCLGIDGQEYIMRFQTLKNYRRRNNANF